MEIIKILWVYFIGFLTIVILDYIWLWYVVKDFTIREFWNLITVDESGSIKIILPAGILAWFVISIMVVTFVTMKYDNIWEIMLYWALLWFLSYSMYDLTNYTFLNNYSLSFTIVDILWGTFVCASVATSTFYFYNFIK